MEHNLPLSPPKRILDRLTPVSPVKRHNRYCPERRGSCRSRFYESSHKTLTSSEVLSRVQQWKVEKKNRAQLKKEQQKQRMLTAQRNRNAVIEERRETARRFSEDHKIWNRFKVKLDVNYGEDPLFASSCEADPFADRHDTTAIGRIAHHLQRYFLRRRLCQTLLLTPLEDLINIQYEEVQNLVQDSNSKFIVKEILQFYHLSNPFPLIPVENVFLTSLLLLSDHMTNTEGKVFDAFLGTKAEEEFGGYSPQWMRDIHILDDDFMRFLTTRQLILSRRLLLRFQVCVLTSSHHHDITHLRFLSTWRSYCDMFRLIQVAYLSRCLLLLCKAIDVLQSDMAIDTFNGCIPEHSKWRLFGKRKDTLVRQLAQWKRRSEGVGMDWCFLGIGLQEKVNQLFEEFEQTKRDKVRVGAVGAVGVVIPPGFSVEEWQKYRLLKFLDEYLGPAGVGIRKMKTGRDLLKSGAASSLQVSEFESMMERIGMVSFREEAQSCVSVEESVVLSFRLFACLGTQLTNQESEFVLRGSEITNEDSYFKGIQLLFTKYSGMSLSCVPGSLSLTKYLHWWRDMMKEVTSQYVDHALENLSFGDFAYQMGVFTLKQRCPVGMTLDDYIQETCLRLRYNPIRDQRVEIPVSTLVVEELLSALRMQRKLPLLFGSMEDELCVLYRKLRHIVGECVLFVVGVSPDDGKVNMMLENLVPREKWLECYRWRALVGINLRVFSRVYEGGSSV